MKPKNKARRWGLISSFVRKIQKALAEQNITMQVDIKKGKVEKVTLLNVTTPKKFPQAPPPPKPPPIVYLREGKEVTHTPAETADE